MFDGGDLFRTEVIDFARTRFGSPVRNPGIKSWVLVSFLTALVATVAAFLCASQYTKRETVLGEVVPSEGILKVSSLRNGTIRQVLVRSGDLVHKDQPLFSISNDLTLVDGQSFASRINVATGQQLRSGELQGKARKAQLIKDRAVLDARRSGLETDLGSLKQQKALQIDRVTLLESTVAAARRLNAQNYMSVFELRQREDTLLQARQAVAQLDRAILQNESQMREIAQQVESLAFQLRESDAGQELERAQMEEKRLNELSAQGGFILAARDGHFTSLQVRSGDVVSAGQPLAMIVPDKRAGALRVHLWAPSRAIGFVRPGDRVRLMFDAFPYQKFGGGSGRVVEVSSAPMMPNELPVPVETREQMYMIVVSLDRDSLDAYGKNWSLTPGMRLTADLVLDRRSLLDWLLEPVLAVRHRGQI